MSEPHNESEVENPWMVTLVQAQLDEMAGVCNELSRAQRDIKFIVPINQPAAMMPHERPTTHIAVFSIPKSQAPS